MKADKLDEDSYVRRLLSFDCFAVTAFPELSKKKSKVWDFESVRKAFSKWVDGRWIEGRDKSIIKISEELEGVEPGSDQFVWYRVNKNKFAGIMILYCIIGFYKSKTNGKRDKHADLIINIMKGISEGIYPTEEILNEINLTYYWNREVMGYFGKVMELKDMTDVQFRALPEQDKWLNTLLDL
jgi:hypothetical protein